MTHRHLLQILATEYQSRYGTWPQGTGYQWEPWVRPFLRILDPPRFQRKALRQHGSCTRKDTK